MSVALLPPVTSSGGEWRGEMPLTRARRYLRGPGNSRWHRVRSGRQWPDGRVSLDYWCGPFATDGPGVDKMLYRDAVPSDDPVCGTCVGRALGAGQDEAPTDLPNLVFSPRWQEPPRYCPGSRSRTLWTPVSGHNVGRCLACDDLVAIRAIGRGYNAWGGGPVIHVPGANLVDPCPFHAWRRIVARDGRPVCGCGWPYHRERVA